MNELTKKGTITSLEIAEATGMRHADVNEKHSKHGGSMGESIRTQFCVVIIQATSAEWRVQRCSLLYSQ